MINFLYFCLISTILSPNMKNKFFVSPLKKFVILVIALFYLPCFSQNNTSASKPSSYFWKNVKFGGAFGLNVGSDYTNVIIAPSAIYPINDYFAAGVGLQGSFVSSKEDYTSAIYGGSFIGLFNPMDAIQLSLELEQLRVNRSIVADGGDNIKDNFWNTGLLLGAGYRVDKVTIGLRYNLLYKQTDFVYNTAMTPFIRIYF